MIITGAGHPWSFSFETVNKRLQASALKETVGSKGYTVQEIGKGDEKAILAVDKDGYYVQEFENGSEVEVSTSVMTGKLQTKSSLLSCKWFTL